MMMPSPELPKLATAVLRVCCPAARLEEIEGDLHELFVRRAAHMGAARARQRYLLDVCSVSLQQLWSRGSRRLSRPLRVGPVRLQLLQGMSVLSVIALLFTLDQRWATTLGYIVLAIGGVLEIGLYVRALASFFTALAKRKPQRRRDV
jgi:hypothetical protein